jgi:hypothetical protein
MRWEGADWRLAQDSDISSAVVITVMNLVFRAVEGMCRLVEELLASQEGICCMEFLVNSYLDVKLLDCLYKNISSFHLEPGLSPILCSISRYPLQTAGTACWLR